MRNTIEGSADLYRCRSATEADFPRLVELGEHFYRQTAYQKIPYGGAASWYQLMLDHGLLFVVEAGNDVIGVIGGASNPFIINPQYGVGMEMLMWVEPEHRGARVADLLLDAIENAARELGLTYWSMIALEAVQPEVAAAVYKRRGYTLAEHNYIKEL